jgi:SAM-dependent methyltransferase
MLEICRRRFQGRPEVQLVGGDIESVSRKFSSFDVVMTCSVIHHVADLSSFFAHLSQLVAPGGVYLMLHEPSQRFYANPDCLQLFEEYQRSKRRRARLRYLNPRRYLRKVSHFLARRATPCLESKTIELLLQRHVIRWPLKKEEVQQLVDIHVPPVHAGRFAIGSGGFDMTNLAVKYLPGFVPVCFRSYGFLGTEFEEVVGERWRARARRLARLYPEDGAQFSALWRRVWLPPGARSDGLHRLRNNPSAL